MAKEIADLDVECRNMSVVDDNIEMEVEEAKSCRDRLVELAFHLNRCFDNNKLLILKNLFRELVEDLFYNPEPCKKEDWNSLQRYRKLLMSMMLHTRDIIAGKGEYDLFYCLVCEWVNVMLQNQNKPFVTNKHHRAMEVLLQQIVEKLVYISDEEHPYGSWKDIKYCLEYLRDTFGIEKAQTLDIWKHLITISVMQMKNDIHTLDSGSNNISFWGKWGPREKSPRFGWLAKYFAKYYVDDSKINIHSKAASIKKQRLRIYRKDLARLNIALRTVQIIQCNHNWSSIDFDNVTSKTLLRQHNAFSYQTELGKPCGTNKDREECKQNYETYINTRNKNTHRYRSADHENTSNINTSQSIKNKLGCVSVEDIISRARKNISNTDSAKETHKTVDENNSINLLWASSGRSIDIFENCIALLDGSGSMEEEDNYGHIPMNAAMGLAIRIAEGSSLGRRILLFNSKPTWLNLDGCAKLTEMVSKIVKNETFGLNSNLYSAMEVIAEACRERDYPPEAIEKLTLVVLSDMGIDSLDIQEKNCHEGIKKIFKNAGLASSHMKEYPVPHIIYWNMRTGLNKHGKLPPLPALFTSENVSYLSGYSQSLLNNISSKGFKSLESCTPWSVLLKQLSHTRYSWTYDALEYAFTTENPSYDPSSENSNNNENNTAGWWW